MANKTEKQALPVRIGKRTIDRLREHAADRDVSLGELVRRIFDEWLKRQPLGDREAMTSHIAYPNNQSLGISRPALTIAVLDR